MIAIKNIKFYFKKTKFLKMVYVLFETPGGFALFKVVKDGKLKDLDNLHESF